MNTTTHKHSAGPWRAFTEKDGKVTIISPDRYVGEVHDWSHKDVAPQYSAENDALRAESVANAQLIASAPELLEALMELFDLLPESTTKSWVKARAAVTKATTPQL